MVHITLVVVAALHALLGLLVLRARRRSAVNRAFAAQSLVFAGWIWGVAGLQSKENLDLRYGFAFAFASLIPVAFLFFSYCYPTTTSWSSPLLRASSLRRRGNVHAAVADDGLDRIRHRNRCSRTFTQAGFTVSGLCPLLHHDLVRRPRHICQEVALLSRSGESQFHYLGVGVIGGFVGGISTNLIFPLVTGHSTYSWIGPYFSLVYVGFVAHAIIRHRLMDLRLFIHRGLTIAIAVALSAVPAAVLIAIFWPRLLRHPLSGAHVARNGGWHRNDSHPDYT